jgi:hypothetical protein
VPAPIIVFAYNRPDHLAAVLAGLAANEGADRSKLFIFCDGPRTRKDEPKVLATRRVAQGASGFLDVSVIEQKKNRGLSASIMAGAGEICDRYGRAIVLEDDVVPTPYFLGYVNAALDRYRDQEDVFSIGCHTFDAGVDLPETFFLNIPDCWGWAIWQRSWQSFQPDGSALLAQIIEYGVSREFDVDGCYPYTRMLKEQVAGLNQSWAIQLYAHTFLSKKLVLYPRRSVTSNIGFDGSGTHGGVSSGYSRVRTADRPIAVSSIDMQESMLARDAWKAALGDMADTSKAGIAGELRSRLGRLYRTLGPHKRKVLP